MAKIEKRSELKKAIGRVCDACHAQGIKVPWLVTAVAINGSVLALRMTLTPDGRGVAAETLVEEHVDDVMVLPINFMIVDATGHAFHFLIAEDDVSSLRLGSHLSPSIKSISKRFTDRSMRPSERQWLSR